MFKHFGYTLVMAWALAASAPSALAQVYKWVDAEGKVHYTDRANDASAGKSTEIKSWDKRSPDEIAPSADDHWKEREDDFQRRKREQARTVQARAPWTPTVASATPSKVNYRDESPKSKCGLAQDILNGFAFRRHGGAIDANDIEVAKRDVGLFCPQKTNECRTCSHR